MIIGGASLAVIVLSAIASGSGGDEKKAATQPAAPIQQAAAAASSAPLLAAAQTPAPASIVAPAPTATPTPDTRLATYAKELPQVATKYSKAMTTISTLSNAPLFTDATWRSKWNQAWQDVLTAGKDAKKLTPPPCMQGAQATFLLAVALYDEAAPLAMSGVRTLDADQIRRATALMTEASPLVGRASTEMGTATATCTA